MTIQHAKQLVAEVAKRAFDAKLFAGTSGNLSICLREEGVVAITPSSIRYETMTADDIVLIDLEANVIEGKHKPSSEHLLHLAFYNANPAVNSVVHTHSPYATAFAVNHKPIPLILLEMVPFLGGEVPVTPMERPGTPEVGIGAVDAIGDKTACLLGNHGVVAIGKDIEQAYIRAEYVEDAAQIAILAHQNGEVNRVPEEMERRMKEGR
ncbi:MAG: class II aldolase/adducin family protein [Oscillospiraceae bacterium]